MVTIYALIDPISGLVRYVGKTSGRLRTRLLAHVNDVRRGRVYIPRHKWIAGLLAEGHAPIIVELDSVEDSQWQFAEQHWIAKKRSEGCDLLNATAGGDGLASYVHRDDTRRKQSDAALRRYQRDSERQKTGAAVKAHHRTDEYRTKASKRASGFSQEHMDKFRSGSLAWARSYGREVARKRFTGRAISEELKAQLSAARLGVKRSQESIEKQRKTITGRKCSLEHIAATAAGQQRRRARERAEAAALKSSGAA